MKRKEEETEMIVKFKLLNGRVMQLDFEDTDKVIDVKNKLMEVEGIHPEQQRLVYSGRQLNDEKTLKESGVQPGATINLLLALRGGY